MSAMTLDLEHLLKLRVAIARFGEMDCAGWWNTKGQLGALAATTLRRNFRRTYMFAQARSVFAVAAHRSAARYDPPNAVTLWRLTATLEDAFDSRWEHWLDHATDWVPFFDTIQPKPDAADLGAYLTSLSLVTPQDLAAVPRNRAHDGHALTIPGAFAGTTRDVTLLAAAFIRSTPGALAVPYQERGE